MSTGADNASSPLADPGRDRCSNCGVSLAHDQRYCINCGERRGKPRFAAPAVTAVAAEPVAAGPPPLRARFSPGATLVAGVATLLLAMGVGVLIGENGAGSSGRPVAYQAPQVIKLNYGAGAAAGGSAGTAAAASTASTKGARHKSSAHSSSSSAPKVVHLTKQVNTQITKALHNVTGGNAKTAAPTTQVGGNCQSGQAGCQGGKFTGNFFGG